MEFDLDRLKRLFHYIVWKADDRPGFGATKLYKVLWFSDAKTFALTGVPITGEIYIRQEHGPIPKHAIAARKSLEADGAIRYTPPRTAFEGARFRAIVKPNMSGFSEKDLLTVDYWIKHIDEDHTADSISEMSHDYSWEIASMGEELPLYAFLATRIRDLTEEEREAARKRAKELGLA